MLSRRELSWLLAWYRHSELEGALLLGRVLRQASDPGLIGALTRHCADEARHAWLWQHTIERLDLSPVRIARAYQSYYVVVPRTLAEVLALTHVFEQRVDREFERQVRSGRYPDAVNATFRALLADEQRHLAWIAEWLSRQPDSETLLDRYRAADEQAYAQLLPYWGRPWEVPGLGEEVPIGAGAA